MSRASDELDLARAPSRRTPTLSGAMDSASTTVDREARHALDSAAIADGSVARPDSLLRLQRRAGNSAVTTLVAGRPAGNGRSVQRTLQRDAGPKQRPGILVHPESGISAAQLVRMLKSNKNVPDFIKPSLLAKASSLALSGKKLKKPEGTFSDFLEPFVDAMTSNQWEITTGHSTIEVGDQMGFDQVVVPDLGKKERLGTTVKIGPDETTFMVNRLVSQKQEVIFGWTISADSTEQLKNGRGLIVVVTKITVKDAKGRTKVFTPTEDAVLEAVMHEISAHAGRITEGKPDGHGTRAVDEIADEVARFFRYSEKEHGAAPSATATQIFDFIGASSGKEAAPVAP